MNENDAIPKNTDEIFSKAEDKTKEFIVKNYTDINEVEFTDHEFTQMGSIAIYGLVNGSKEFNLNLFYKDNYSVGTFSYDETFPKVKEECKDKRCK